MPIIAKSSWVPAEVAAIRHRLRAFLNIPAPNGKQIGNSQYGVYAFFDYDGEPIYVGKTKESLRTRIRRHLTNQRTDAVAMNVLDPFEVCDVEVWPMWELEALDKKEAERRLARTEYSAFQKVLLGSSFNAVLNEQDIPSAEFIALPSSYRQRIIPDELYKNRQHADIRIARRAMTIANLARVISEREVSVGLRRTLSIQARRLERLASVRYAR